MCNLDPQPLLASIIVPVFNGAHILGNCLDALDTQTVNAQQYEIIIVDDGSTDGSAEAAARQGGSVIRQEHAGAGAARNLGARQASGPILLFTDADCEPQSDWAEKMLAPFADPDVAGVKGVYRTRQSALVARFTQAEYEEKYDRLARTEQIDFVDTYAAAYRRDIFLAHGGFDPEFLLDEDQELSFRLAKAGHKLVFAPAAIVYHQHPDSIWTYARRKMGLGYWKVRVHARHPAKAVRNSYTPWTQKAQLALLPLTGALALATVMGWVSWMGVALPAMLGLVSTGPLMAKATRQGWQVAALTPIFALVRALALGLGLAWGMISQLKHRS